MQYPIVYTLLGGWKTAHPEATLDQTLVINVMCYLLSVGVAYASLKLYDIPVRRWLQANWLHRK